MVAQTSKKKQCGFCLEEKAEHYKVSKSTRDLQASEQLRSDGYLVEVGFMLKLTEAKLKGILWKFDALGR